MLKLVALDILDWRRPLGAVIAQEVTGLLETCRAVLGKRNRFTFMDVARAMVTLAEEAGEMPPGVDATPGQLALHLGISRQNQLNWRKNRQRWVQRMRQDLALEALPTTGKRGEGRGQRLTAAQWELVGEVRSRNRYLDGESFAQAVRQRAMRAVKEDGRADLGRLQAFSRVMAWRYALKIQELATEFERKREEEKARGVAAPAEEDVSDSPVASLRIEQQEEFTVESEVEPPSPPEPGDAEQTDDEEDAPPVDEERQVDDEDDSVPF